MTTQSQPTQDSSGNRNYDGGNGGGGRTAVAGDGMEEDSNPFNDIKDQIKSYISDPSLVTKDTLTDLLNKVMELQDAYENDEPEDSGDSGEGSDHKPGPGIAIMISRGKK